MDRTQKIFKGKHISFIGSSYTRTVGEMVLEHYDTDQYHNVLVITWPILDVHDDNIYYKQYDFTNVILMNLERFKETYSKIILYDLEHTGYWIMPWIHQDYLSQIDEIWTPWLESIGCFDKNKVKFMPMRYCKSLMDGYVGNFMKSWYDLGFLGSMSDEPGLKHGMTR